VCRHVFAHLRPNHKTTASSPVPVCRQMAKLPLPRIPTSHSNRSRLFFPDAYPPSPTPSLTLSSIAAPTTASAFLQASLSKMPRSNFSRPQHPAPRHFRSRLTTIRTSADCHNATGIRIESLNGDIVKALRARAARVALGARSYTLAQSCRGQRKRFLVSPAHTSTSTRPFWAGAVSVLIGGRLDSYRNRTRLVPSAEA
jgi:hypothetical protein